MNKKSQNNGGGIGFLGALQIAFIVLKLCGVVKWNWLVVMLPSWVFVALIVLVLFLMIGSGGNER